MNRSLHRLAQGIARLLHWAASSWFTTINSAEASTYEVNKRSLRRYLPKNPVIVEAGAHIGGDTLELSIIWPEAEIHAFEPVPELYFQMSRRTTHAPGVLGYPFALGSARAWEKMRLSSGASDASSSLLKPKEHLELHPDVLFDREIDVPIVSLDEWAETYGIRQVDLLWLDLQGFELAALKGGEKLLRTTKVVYTEVNLLETYEGAPHYREVRSWLESRGFSMIAEFLPFPDGGNVLFVRRS